jgi:hypothetical protein
MNMSHRQKFKRLARILVGKHNGAAKEVARERVQLSFDNDDYASAHLWTDVAETLRQIAADHRGTGAQARHRTG